MNPTKQISKYLVASDFDKTLSFNDSGYVLCDIIGVRNFEEKVAGMAQTNLVHQGAELAYLLRHDPEFRRIRREDLIRAGKGVRLKHNVKELAEVFAKGLPGCRFPFYVISSGVADVVRSALEGIVPPENIYGTELEYDERSGEICCVKQVPAGYGKVAVLQELEVMHRVSPDRTIYIGDGVSDLYAMQHVNCRDGHTISVSKSKFIGRIAKRSVLSDNALSVLVPILEDILNWDSYRIRSFFASHGLALQDWDKIRTDWLTFGDMVNASGSEALLAG